MSNLFFSKYGLRIGAYKTKKFLGEFFSTRRGGDKKRSRLFSFLAVLIIFGLIISLSVYGFNLTGEAGDKTKISAETYNKIVYYDAVTGNWSDFSSGTENINAMAMANLGGGDATLIYSTNSSLKRVLRSTKVVSSITTYPGNISNIVDMDGANNITYVLEKSGDFYYTSDGGSSWVQGPIINYSEIGNQAKRIGSDGATANIVLYGDNKIAVNTVSGWFYEGKPTALLAGENITSVEFSESLRMISTDGGRILQSGPNVANNYQALKYISPGGYIYPNLYHNIVGSNTNYYFGTILSGKGTNNPTVGFIQYIPNLNEYATYLHAIIPGCKIDTSIVYQGSPGVVDYAATVQDTCTDPNNPTTPLPSGTITNIENTYNYNYKGISIHTKAENFNGGPDYANSATVKKGSGHIVRFTLTVNNGDVAKPVDVRFTLPAGFTYAGNLSYGGLTGCTPLLPAVGSAGGMTWQGCNAPVGDSTIVFDTNAP